MNREIDGTRLANMLERSGLSIRELSKKAPADYDNLRKNLLKPGTHEVREFTIDRLAKALECEVKDLEPQSIVDQFGIDLKPINSKSMVYPGINNYKQNADFSFKSSFLLTPKADGALVAFKCSLFKWIFKRDIPNGWCVEEYERLHAIDFINRSPEEDRRYDLLMAELLEFPLKRHCRRYAWNRRPGRGPENQLNGDFEVNGAYVPLDTDCTYLKTPISLKSGVPINITYARECSPGQMDEAPVDYLLDNRGHISCSMATIMDRSRPFEDLTLSKHEWLFWFTYGGAFHEGNAPLK